MAKKIPKPATPQLTPAQIEYEAAKAEQLAANLRWDAALVTLDKARDARDKAAARLLKAQEAVILA